MKKKKDKPKFNIWQNVCFMIRMAWNTRKSLLLLCVTLVVILVAEDLLKLYITPQILSKVETKAPIGSLLQTIAVFSLSLALISGLRRYFSFFDSKTIVSKSPLTDVRNRGVLKAINHKAGVTSYPNTRIPEVQKLLSNAINATDGSYSPAEYIWYILIQIVMALILFIIYIPLLSNLNGFLVLVSIVTTALGFWLDLHYHTKRESVRKERGHVMKQLQYCRMASKSVTHAKDIRIFGLGPWLEQIHETALNIHDALIYRYERTALWGDITKLICILLRNAVAYIYLVQKALSEGLSAGEFLLYFNAITNFSGNVDILLNSYVNLMSYSLPLSCVQEYLELPEQFRFEGGEPIPCSDTWELKLKNVTFTYPGSDHTIFRNIDLTIAPGEKLAVVGLNGVGKTTLVKLLCGLYDPDQGRVLLNGTDIRNFNRDEYYRLFSAVFQDSSIMEATIAENIAQTTQQVNESRLWDCIEKAGLAKDIRKLSGGINAHVGRTVHPDGILLSGGQTQRLMLARALYKDGPILILDEPTSALDPLAEHDIYRKYNQMTAGKTSLFISHRLASTRFCDRIVYLANGGVAEEGTHEQLLELGGEYAKLFQIQSRYYQDGRDPA